jgi:hypothetical protein
LQQFGLNGQTGVTVPSFVAPDFKSVDVTALPKVCPVLDLIKKKTAAIQFLVQSCTQASILILISKKFLPGVKIQHNKRNFKNNKTLSKFLRQILQTINFIILTVDTAENNLE